jgi:hypothetical protein
MIKSYQPSLLSSVLWMRYTTGNTGKSSNKTGALLLQMLQISHGRSR